MLLFNLLKVTFDVVANPLSPRTKIKGKLLAEKLRDNDDTYVLDQNWKNSSKKYAPVLRDVDDNVVIVFLKKKSVTIQETSYKMPLETCQELIEVSVAFENSLHILI